ncbi:MAG: hypothetical protein DME02_03845 [Candidatus Rokuibacteriota bacterium]|nr:MAG: hypothetical protein DME02_03845 [Candidatus Rokubacteria bacterium]
MSPGGHLVTTAVACVGAATLTESWAVTTAVAAGGFFIDLDHAADYVLFERNRALTPDAFLRHYVEGRMRWAVLVLHSYELFALLGLIAWWTGSLWLTAYLWGASLHLALDLTFNGEVTPKSIVAFYSFAYRLAHGFDARRLLGRDFAPAPTAFWSAFFRGGRAAGAPSAPLLARTWPPSKPSC